VEAYSKTSKNKTFFWNLKRDRLKSSLSTHHLNALFSNQTEIEYKKQIEPLKRKEKDIKKNNLK